MYGEEQKMIEDGQQAGKLELAKKMLPRGETAAVSVLSGCSLSPALSAACVRPAGRTLPPPRQ